MASSELWVEGRDSDDSKITAKLHKTLPHTSMLTIWPLRFKKLSNQLFPTARFSWRGLTTRSEMKKASLTPSEVVNALDKNIVGQGAAKKAMAVALRDRWRRGQVD